LNDSDISDENLIATDDQAALFAIDGAYQNG
jgi:hypothetical protein